MYGKDSTYFALHMCMEVIAKLLNTSAVLANMIAHAVQHWWLIGFYTKVIIEQRTA